MKLSSDTRELVQRRAHAACEYCRLPQDGSILPHQVDHIIGRQHRGSDDADNLCFCCIRCNLKKGPNIASVDPETNLIVSLYNPRRQSVERTGEHVYSVDVLKRLAVPASAIRVLPDHDVSTADEIRTIERALRAESANRVILVTSTYHSRRVRAIWRALVGAEPHAIVRYASGDPFEPEHWWRTTTDLMAVSREWFGLLNAWAGFPVASIRGQDSN